MVRKSFFKSLKDKLNVDEVAPVPINRVSEDSVDIRKIRMNVKGLVQGVGFRYMTKRVADNLGVSGAVWNEPDGSVAIEAIATKQVMETFIKMIKSSPSPSGRVDDVKVEEAPDLPFTSEFKVTYR